MKKENRKIMERTFHRKASIASLIFIGALALLTFYFFWQGKGWNILCGIALLLLTAISIERLIHTTYFFTEDGQLVINSGRASKRHTIAIKNIERITSQRALFGIVRYLLIEYDTGKLRSIQPENEAAFIEEFKKLKVPSK